MSESDEDLLFAGDGEGAISAPGPTVQPWKILIVDDEQQVHAVTRMVLTDLIFQGKPIEFLSAYSGREGRELLLQHSDIAVVFLDVVMETDHAGLDLVRTIRDELNNTYVRIILRTGQPGQAPERRVILEYDINDYKEKSELTAQKLFSTVVTALRSYQDLMTIEASRRGLEKIIIAAASLFQLHSMEMFLSGVLQQIGSLLTVGTDAVMLTARSDRLTDPRPTVDSLQVIAGTGRFASMTNRWASNVLDHRLLEEVATVMRREESVYRSKSSLVYFHSRRRRTTVLYLETDRDLKPIDHNLIQLFCNNASISLDNLI